MHPICLEGVTEQIPNTTLNDLQFIIIEQNKTDRGILEINDSPIPRGESNNGISHVNRLPLIRKNKSFVVNQL